jgi:hypothetical protein
MTTETLTTTGDRLTLEQAFQLVSGDILTDHAKRRWKVNGQVRTWKTDDKRIKVPLKHGLYTYDNLSGNDFDEDGVCFHDLRLAD